MLISLSANQHYGRASVSSLPAAKETMSLPCSQVRRKSDTYDVQKASHDKADVEPVIIHSFKSYASDSTCSLSINDSYNNNSTIQRHCSFHGSNNALEDAASEKESDKPIPKKKQRKRWYWPKFLYWGLSKTQTRAVARSNEAMSPSLSTWSHGNCSSQPPSLYMVEILKKNNNNNDLSNTIYTQATPWKKKKNENNLELDQYSKSETEEKCSINYKRRAFGSKKSDSVRSWAKSLRQSFKFSVTYEVNGAEEDC